MIIGVIIAFLFICLKSQSSSTTPLNAQTSSTRQSNIFPSAPPAYDSIYPDLNDNHNQYQSAPPPPPPGFKTNFNSRDDTNSSSSSSSSSGWSSFLTGAALGSAGTYLLNRNRNK